MSDIRLKIQNWLDDFKRRRGFNLAWFIRYALGGTATVIIEFAAFFLFSRWEWPWLAIVGLLPAKVRPAAAGELQLWAIVISNVLSYVVNYFISKYWVFRSPQTKHRRDATLFLISSITNLAVVLVSAKLLLLGLELLPLGGVFWTDKLMPLLAKIGSNIAAFVTVLVFKRFVIWNDVSKY